jgi:hypothetical protein
MLIRWLEMAFLGTLLLMWQVEYSHGLVMYVKVNLYTVLKLFTSG